MSETPTIEELPNEPGGNSSGGEGGDGLLSGVPLTRRQLLVLAVVLAVLAYVYASRQSDGDASSADASDDESDDTEAVEGDLDVDLDESVGGEGEAGIVVPTDPEDELDKDAAVLEALRESGHMGDSD
jgi:hypothetical protein